MVGENKWLVETQDLCKVFGDGEEIRALDNVNVQISAGELISVMGPSGSGKSTLLNILGALDIPSSGIVKINGQDLTVITDKDQFRSQKVGFVFQLHNLLPTLNALENVEVPLIGHQDARERKMRAEELLGLVGLADRMNHLPNQLSGGQRQRVAVARALANNPPLILADEPTGNLDTTAGQDLMKLIAYLNTSQGTTFIVVTHDPSIARLTRRVIVMADGKIVREDIIGSPLEEDLKMWRHSGLGRRFIKQEDDSLDELHVSKQEQKVIRRFLEEANSK